MFFVDLDESFQMSIYMQNLLRYSRERALQSLPALRVQSHIESMKEAEVLRLERPLENARQQVTEVTGENVLF